MSAILLCCLLQLGVEAPARSCRVALLPNGGKFSCANCHVSRAGGRARNVFGQSVGPLVGSRCVTFWGPALAAADADGDGISNGEELQDPSGAWRPGMPAPGSLPLVTNPGVADAPAPRRFVRGDANSDGRVDISDALWTLGGLFAGGPLPGCRGAADINGDLVLDLTDALFTLTYLFSGGVRVPAPFPACGSSASSLDCSSYPPCE